VKRSWLAEVLRPRRTEMQARIDHYVDRAEEAEKLAAAAVRNERRAMATIRRKDLAIAALTDQLELLQAANERHYREQQDAAKQVTA
jgi:hypothetical protein